MVNQFRRVIPTLLCLFLYGCGGGGGGGDSADPPAQAHNSGSGSTGGPITPDPDSPPVIQNKSVTLAWTAPSVRADGNYLSMGEISGYEIYYTTENSGESASINIDGGDVDSHKLDALTADIYHFSISTIDTGQLKSTMSDVLEVDLR